MEYKNKARYYYNILDQDKADPEIKHLRCYTIIIFLDTT